MGHPRFEHAKIITKNNERFLSTTITADEKEYYKWKEQFKKLNGKHEALLMPVNEEFERSGLCGSAGVVNVHM